MEKDYDAILKFSEAVTKALFTYATLGITDMSSDEAEDQMETCRDIADFIVFCMDMNVTISNSENSFEIAGKFANPDEKIKNFVEDLPW